MFQIPKGERGGQWLGFPAGDEVLKPLGYCSDHCDKWDIKAGFVGALLTSASQGLPGAVSGQHESPRARLLAYNARRFSGVIMSTEDPRFAGVARLYGEQGLERLRRAHVAIAGIGGVGSWAAEAMARSGVGEITLFDLG